MRSSAADFATLFGGQPTVVAMAPGRVNLLGEHTDYNLGWVLPTAIPQATRVEMRLRSGADRRVAGHSASVDAPDAAPQSYVLGQEVRRGTWIDAVQGVTQALSAGGCSLSGFDLRVASDVPVGSGLSSSAALGVALLRALRQLFALPLSEIDIARLCQRVENEFLGAPVGILDPMACAFCQPGQALLLDTRDLTFEQLPLPDGVELIVLHSGIAHAHGKRAEQAAPVEDYRARRAECERAAQKLGVASLRELDDADLVQPRIAALAETLQRRVRHVVSENARVHSAARLLRQRTHGEADLRLLGELFAASHRSQRDDYNVSLPAIDTLVDIAADDRDVLYRGARLTGGGFGGSIVALGRAGCATAAAARIAARYLQRTGHTPIVLLPQPAEADA